MRVFRIMGIEEAVAVMRHDPLENHTDFEAQEWTASKSKGFCFFPFTQTVRSCGIPLRGRYGHGKKEGLYYKKFGVVEAWWCLERSTERSPIVMVLEVPDGSLRESVGRYNLQPVFGFYEDWDDYVGFGYVGHLDRVHEYCAETYPEGYEVVGVGLFPLRGDGIPDSPELTGWRFRGKPFESMPEAGSAAMLLEMLRYLAARRGQAKEGSTLKATLDAAEEGIPRLEELLRR